MAQVGEIYLHKEDMNLHIGVNYEKRYFWRKKTCSIKVIFIKNLFNKDESSEGGIFYI